MCRTCILGRMSTTRGGVSSRFLAAPSGAQAFETGRLNLDLASDVLTEAGSCAPLASTSSASPTQPAGDEATRPKPSSLACPARGTYAAIFTGRGLRTPSRAPMPKPATFSHDVPLPGRWELPDMPNGRALPDSLTGVSNTSTDRRFLVLVTGYAAAGKTTIAPLLADELDALWISRDRIHEMVYSGWEPQHPALTSETYDPRVDDSVFLEGSVVWNIFLWMLQRTTTRVPVVADTPFNHDWNRTMFQAAANEIEVPVVEVALHGAPDVLLQRARLRAASGEVHELKARFSVNPARYYASAYRPVLAEEQVVRVDTTDLDSVDAGAVAAEVRGLVGLP